MNHTPHPIYPFQDEEREEIVRVIESKQPPEQQRHEVFVIRNKFEAMRNDQFPGWHERYQAEMQEWFKGRKA